MTEGEKTFLTEREAAEYLGVGLDTLRTMEIEGSLIPFRTLGGHCGYSLRILNEYLGKSYEPPHHQESKSASEVQDDSLSPVPEMQDQSSPPIDVLNLSVHSYNFLQRSDLRTVAQVAALSDEEILAIRQVGPKALADIREKMAAYLAEHPLLDKAQESPPEPETQESEPAPLPPPSPPPDPTPLGALGLSIRPHNALRRSGITTIGQLARMSDEEIRYVPNIGPKSLAEIRDKLKAYLAVRPLPTELTPPETKPKSPSSIKPPSVPEKIKPFMRPLKVLKLSFRAYNALMDAGITMVEQLAAMSDPEILLVPGIGRSSLAKIKRKLEAYLTAHPLPTEPMSEIAGRGISPAKRLDLAETSLQALVEEWLSPLTIKQGLVIRWRFGLRGEELSLGEAGERLDLTRERVRQVQNKALDILKKSRRCPIIRLLSEFMLYLLEQAGGLMNEVQVEAALRRELVIGDVNPVGVARLAFKLDANVKQFRKVKAWGLRSYPLDEVNEMQAQLARVLQEEHAPLPVNEVVARFQSTRFYRRRQDVLKDDFILACLRVHPDILIGEDNRCSLQRWKRSRTDEIILALRAIGESAHYEAIAEKTNALLEPEMRTSVHNIHAILGRRTDLFVRVGHGIFGLKEWGLPDDGSLANAAYRALSEAGRPLHIEAITDGVLGTWRASRPSVHAAIHNDDRFYRAAPATFGLMEWEIERLDEAQPVLNICPPPLPDRRGERNTFFESVLVARNLLRERHPTAAFLEAMLKWVGTDVDKSERYLQNMLNAYYVVGLIPYTVYRRAADAPLHSTLLETDDLQILRGFCLNCMMERLARMPEFMALLAVRQPCTRADLRDWFYKPGTPLDDVKNRVRLLFNLGMLHVEKRGQYRLTSLGVQVTQELEAAGQLKYPASLGSWEQMSRGQPIRDDEFDVIDFELS